MISKDAFGGGIDQKFKRRMVAIVDEIPRERAWLTGIW